MSKHLNLEVMTELAERFSPQDLLGAKMLLENTSPPLLDNLSSVDAARIHMAAIKLAGGELEKLKSVLLLASSDWRDLLLAAGLANADWQQVLAKEGFRIPRRKE